MFLSIVENPTWSDDWTNHCRTIKADVLSNKTIKKPYEDINDAFLITKII